MSAIIFNGKDAKLLTGRDLLGSDGSVYGKGNEKSYTAGAARATYWGTSGAGITIADDFAAADLPRPSTTATGLKITGVSGSTAYAYYRFVLDDADANTKLKVQFALKPVSGYVSNDFKVDVYSNTASDYTTGNTRLALSTDSSAVTGIPNLTGTFRTTFDAPAVTAKWIEVRIGLNGTNTHACVFSDVVVGPGVVVQGAVVTAPLAYTPTLTALGTVTTQSFEYSRRGSSVRVVGSLTTGTPTASAAGVGLPNGYTCHTSSGLQVVGRWEVHVATSNTIKSGPLTANSGDSAIRFGNDDYTNGGVPDTAYNGATLFSAGALVYVYFEVEANELQGSGTVSVASNDVEYAASTTGTWDANALVANTVYGPGGAAMSGTLTTSRTKAVQFVTPIQATDKIYLEYRNATTGIWVDQALSEFPYTQTAPIAFGAGILHSGTTSNSVTVLFNQYAQAGTAFGSATGASNWSSSFYDFWRLRKVSGGQAVGFGIVQPGVASGLVSASGLPGNTTGTFTAGYVGELLGTQRSGTGGSTYSARATATPGSSFASQVSQTLNIGTYLITVSASAVNTGGSLGYQAYLAVGGTQVTSTFFLQAPVNDEITLTFTVPVLITTNSTAVALYAKDTGTTSAAGVQEMWAVRIA